MWNSTNTSNCWNVDFSIVWIQFTNLQKPQCHYFYSDWMELPNVNNEFLFHENRIENCGSQIKHNWTMNIKLSGSTAKFKSALCHCHSIFNLLSQLQRNFFRQTKFIDFSLSLRRCLSFDTVNVPFARKFYAHKERVFCIPTE